MNSFRALISTLEFIFSFLKEEVWSVAPVEFTQIGEILRSQVRSILDQFIHILERPGSSIQQLLEICNFSKSRRESLAQTIQELTTLLSRCTNRTSTFSVEISNYCELLARMLSNEESSSTLCKLFQSRFLVHTD
jgi:hypothetical protein